MRLFSTHIQMLYVESIRATLLTPVQLNAIQLLHRKEPSANAPIKEHLDPHVRYCVTMHSQITWNITVRNVLLREEHPLPYLVHVVAVEAVTGVAVRTRATLHTLGRLYAHVLTETDARHAFWLHHLAATQTFCRQTNV